MPTYATGHARRSDKDFLIALSARRHARMFAPLMAVPPPAAWDSVALGWVGPIKDQSSCGSCWDFSGTCMVESAYFKAGLLKPDGTGALSEEYTLSCCRNGGCNGDDNVTVLDWAKTHGLPLTSDYGKYTGGPGRCLFKPQMTLYKVDDWGFCDPDPNNKYSVASVESIKAAIMAYGVVGSAIAADNAFMNSPAGKVFKGSGSRDINHDIALVGWDDDKGAWRLRNSWNTSWCDGGYQWIAYGANQVGTEAVWCRVNAANPPIDWFI